MKGLQTIFYAAVFVFLAGCSSVSRDFVYTNSDPSAFVVMATDELPVSGTASYNFTFTKVNTSESKFAGDSYAVSLSGSGAEFGDELKRPAELRSSVRYGAKRIPTGTYALTMIRIDASYGMLNQRTIVCNSQGAPVFEFSPGVVNLISVGNPEQRQAPNEEIAFANVKEILKGYPNIIAPVQIIQPVRIITFDGKGPLGRNRCKLDGTYE